MVESLANLFDQLKVKADVVNYKQEGSFFVYDIKLKPNGTYSKLERCVTEISLCLKSLEAPIIYPIMNEGIIRMEVMMSEPDDVLFSDIKDIKTNHILPLILGKQRNGEVLTIDLSKMPHLLVGGATGSGKSVMLHTIINSLLNCDRNIRFAFIDPKRVELADYNSLSCRYSAVAKDIESSMVLLDNLVREMDRRFLLLSKEGAKNIQEYSKKMPYIVLIIDELADLMMGCKKDTQRYVCKLAQKSRACGIHLVLATQRPSVDVLTGLIKANFPARLSCKVSSAVDSRVLLDRIGAERLAGKGDAIIKCDSHDFTRFKGAYTTRKDIMFSINKQKKWWTKIWNS